MNEKKSPMQDICEFEQKTDNDIDIEYRNAIRHLLLSSYRNSEMNKHLEKELTSRDSVCAFYHYMYGSHPAEEESKELFAESAHEDANAELKANSVTDQFYDYISGYRDAADILVMNSLVRGNKEDQDASIFPICFLYRQYIELSLKDMYLYYSADTGEEKDKYMKSTNHNLWHVWENKVSPMIKPLLEEQYQIDEYDLIEKYIKEFNELDTDSYMFRYPITKSRKQYHTSSRKINIVGLMEKMSKVEEFFASNAAFLDTVKFHRECNNFVNEAHGYVEKQEFDKAIDSYNKALNIKQSWNGEDHSDVVYLYTEMSAVYMMQTEHTQAIELLDKAIAISGRIKSTTFLHIIFQYKGMLFSMQKETTLAIEAFEKSIEYDPGDDPIIIKSHLYAARENRKIDKNEKAMQHYEKALAVCETFLSVEHKDYIAILGEKEGCAGKDKL